MGGARKYITGLIEKARGKVQGAARNYSPYKQVNEALSGKVPSKPEIKVPPLTPANKRKKIKPKEELTLSGRRRSND